MKRPGKLIPAESINSKELPEPELTIKEFVVKYLKENGEIQRSELYDHIKRNEVTIRKSIRELVAKGIINERECDCGRTRFISL